MPNALALIGRRFGRLVVVKREAEVRKSGHWRWLCRCACGGRVTVRGSSLVSGTTRSCGCLWGKGIWRKENITAIAGHVRAQKLYPKLGRCERCRRRATDRHHIDGNPLNNTPMNIKRVCRRCHIVLDGRMKAMRRRARNESGSRWVKG